MAFIVEDLVFFNPDLNESEGEGTRYPADNIGDVIEVRAKVRLENYLIVTTQEADDGLTAIYLNPESEFTGEAQDDRLIWTSDNIGFEEVQEGDLYTVQINTLDFRTVTVIEKKNSQLILVEPPFGLGGQSRLTAGRYGYVSTPIESIEILDNLIENNDAVTYLDKTTGVTRRARVEGLSNNLLTDTPMIQLGDKSYQHGSLSVAGNGIGDGLIASIVGVPDVSQAFIIKRTLLIAPLTTANELDNDLNGIAPTYLKDSNSLKYIFRIEASKDLNNPNDIKTVVEFETLGSVGWEKENLNTGLTNYTIENVIYKRLSGEVIDSLELSTNEMTVEFDVINTVDSPFSGGIGNTRIIFNHAFMPADEKEYRVEEFPTEPSTSKDNLLKTNFLFDKAVTILDSGVVAGENFGGEDQIIKESESIYISNSKAHVINTIKMSSQAVTRISALTDQNYKIWISTANHALTRAKSDKVNFPADKNTYFTETQDPTMITTTHGFFDYPMVEGDTPKESLLIQPMDNFTCRAIFTLDRNDIPDFPREDATISFLSATAQIIARNGSRFFILDEFEADLAGSPIINDATSNSIPVPNVKEDQGFISPVDDLRRNGVVKRRTDLDTPATGLYNYEISFPVIMRSDPFDALTAAPTDFLDETAPANHHEGRNHDWFHYLDGTGWNLALRTIIVATKDGVPQTYTHETSLSTQDFTDGLEWDTEVNETYKTDASGDIIANQGLMTSQNTLIQFEMDYINPDVPSLPDLTLVLWQRRFDEDNYKNTFYYSDKYDATTDNAMIGLGGSLTATKSNPSGTTFRVEAENNHLNGAFDVPEFGMRIYDDRPDSGIPDGKTLAQGGLKTDGLSFVKDIV